MWCVVTKQTIYLFRRLQYISENVTLIWLSVGYDEHSHHSNHNLVVSTQAFDTNHNSFNSMRLSYSENYANVDSIQQSPTKRNEEKQTFTYCGMHMHHIKIYGPKTRACVVRTHVFANTRQPILNSVRFSFLLKIDTNFSRSCISKKGHCSSTWLQIRSNSHSNRSRIRNGHCENAFPK